MAERIDPQTGNAQVMFSARNAPPPKTSKKKNIFGLSLALLMIVGAIFIFQYPLTLLLVSQNHKKYDLSKVSTAQIAANKKKGDFTTANVKTVNFIDVANAQMENQQYPVIGAVAYPDLGIELPIFNGDGYTTMIYGAGTMKPNQVMGEGNYAIASHHVSNVIGNWADHLLFSALEDAKQGQKIYLTDKSKVYIYEVTEVLVVVPTESNVIDDVPGKKEVTLVTCYSDSNYRLIVHGDLKGITNFNQSDAQLFSGNYNQWIK
jgi:sortase A